MWAFPMLLVRRVGTVIPSLIGVIVVTFALTHLMPGDPAAYYAGPAATSESVAQIRKTLALDQPLIVQFFDYVGKLAHFDLGTSWSSGQPVIAALAQRLPASLELTTFALFLAVAFALPLGILAAIWPNSPVDHVCRVFVSLGAAFPTFFVGMLLVYVFYYIFDIAPQPLGRLNEIYYAAPKTVTGFLLIDTLLAGDREAFRGSLAQLMLPSISLGLFALAPIARITRASMLSALKSDFVRTARSLGLSPTKIIFKYAFRNAITQIVGILGMVFSFLLSANVLVEQVFGWPGVGAYAVKAVIASDYAAVQGFVFVMAIMYTSLNFVVDLVSASLDPRVRADA